MDKPEKGITTKEDNRIRQPVEIPLFLQIDGEPRLTIEMDGRIIHKGVVIGQDQELADMLMGKVSIEEHADIPDRGEQPQGSSE